VVARDEDRITVSRKEYEALRSRSMSKEERQLRQMIREEVAGVLGEVFDFGTDEGTGERKGGGLLKAVGSFLGGEESSDGDEDED
jgi:hypothetical protein